MLVRSIIILLTIVCCLSIKGLRSSQNHNSKPEQPQEKKEQGSYEVKLNQINGHLYLPTQIQNKDFNIQLTNSKTPSWIFIQKGQLCISDKCKNIKSQIQCLNCKKQHISNNQQDTNIESKQMVQLSYLVKSIDKSHTIKTKFYVASKVNSNSQSNSTITLNLNSLQQFTIKQSKNQIYGTFGTDKKQNHVETQNQDQIGKIIIYSDKKQEIKLDSQNIFFDVSTNLETNKLFTFPLQTYNNLKQIMLKVFFDGKCKINSEYIICKKAIDQKQFVVQICISQQICFKLNAQSLVKKINSKKYEFEFNYHESDQIGFNVPFLKLYTIILNKGKIVKLEKNPNYKIIITSAKNNEPITAAQPNSTSNKNQKGIFFMIGVYVVIAFLIVLVVKLKATESLVAGSIDFMFGKVTGFFHRQKGYQASKMAEQIDDSNTVSMGYNKDFGGQMFWQKNSVQGI